MDRVFTRRAFVGALAAVPALAADDGWISLFNGRDLNGWRPSEHKDSWQVRDGAIVADGARSHLFYTGPVQGAVFKNFDLEVDALARPECNSGVYFHTAYQETGFPIKGFEVQIANTALGEGTYRERKKTGSLYGLRNVYKQLIADDTWFKIQVAVRGKNVQIRLDGVLVVDYVEPTPPVIPPGMERERFLDRGTFALQCHNPGSIARFRSIRVRPAADDAPTPGPVPVVDDTFRQIIDVGRNNIPVVDYHVHLKGGMTLEQALARSRRDGINYGIAVNCGKGNPIQDDAAAIRFSESMKGQPCFVAMQAEGREWLEMFTRQSVGLFDYVFTDSMTWTDNHGKRMRLWIPEETGTITDVPEFMETFVSRTVGILEKEPIDIYVNPTYLPDQIAKDYDRLWTEERMRKVAEAAAGNHVAIELNDRYKLPSAAFVKMAKAAGCKFTFGTNNAGADDLRRSEYGLRMVQECHLGWQDFFVPGAWWPKAAERKRDALRA
ncbi:MAG TPA: family 16 glycoside hydrolase [Verrucomicrobiae bacterium]|nr:family 16 glycoside hydrolase [Verrucomicrobiae bacterium]